MKRQRFSVAAVALVVLGIWGAWFFYVLRFWAPGPSFFGYDGATLTSLGAFGDAFGVLGSLMAALAASAAYSAYLRQQEEAAAQEFERNFFTLLNNLQIHIQETDVRRFNENDVAKLKRQTRLMGPSGILLFDDEKAFLTTKAEIRGRDAFRVLKNRLRRSIKDYNVFRDSAHVHRIYKAFFQQWHDDLGHYFRTLYHIFKMIDERCPSSKKRYAQIVRSHLSNSEIILIAYNCSVGGGQGEFKRLLNEYEILHNYHLDRRDIFF